MKRTATLALAALSLAALACTCGLLGGFPRSFLPSQVQEGVDEIEAFATEFDADEFEQDMQELQEFGESVELGADFPSDFPIPAGVSLETSYEIDGSISAVFTSTGTVEEVVTGFESALASGGYSIDSKEEVTTPVGATVIYKFSGANWSGELTIVGSDGSLGVNLTLNPAS